MISLFAGCAGPVMMKAQQVDKSDSDYALVTFMRKSVFMGDGVSFGVWDKEKFIGILTAGTYLQYKAEPGEHLFLARGENWSLVKANLEAGKHYYISGRVFPGVWKARIALDPVNEQDAIPQSELDETLKRLTPYEVIPEKVESYSKSRLRHIRKAIQNYENGKTKYLTLKASDGR